MLLVIICMFLLHATSSLYLYKPYSQYLQQWRLLTSTNPSLKQITIIQNSFALPFADCISPCQYPIFQYKPNSTHWLPIILLISGFHGDQPLSPHILLEFARNLNQPSHIIFFPLSNPSGYAHKLRQQYPSNIDPNRDFPYNNQQCMNTATSRIVDKIFRKWKIDLTVSLHQGGEELGWNWGTKLHLNQKTKDQLIYEEIGNGVVREFNSGFLGMEVIKLGQMNQIIYSAEGTFDDWAYAGSWDTLNTKKQCMKFKFEKYDEDMHQGLVFIFETAPHNVQESNLESQKEIQYKLNEGSIGRNDYISRGVKILRGFVDVANPRLEVGSNKQQIGFSVIGCHTAKLFVTINDRIHKITVKGSLNPEFAPSIILRSQIDHNATQNSLKFSYEISCDVGWRDLGRTSFSRGRDYKGVMEVVLSDQEAEKDTFSLKGIIVIGTVVIVIGLIVGGYFARRAGHRRQMKHRTIKEENSFRSSNQSGSEQRSQNVMVELK